MAGGTDSFEAYTPRAADTVDALVLTFKVRDGEDGNDYSATYEFYIKDADGRHTDLREGNLVPHLTSQQVTALKNFVDGMFAKAKGTVGG